MCGVLLISILTHLQNTDIKLAPNTNDYKAHTKLELSNSDDDYER